ncbi:MAG: AAA family ATPase [Tannerellaceae bacterium]|nr:AAA family ATPase [Tannerellaceae bacterium]
MSQPKFVAFSTQKGGVGKTTFTVLSASYLYYLKGYNVAIIDCDFPQHSICKMRERDAEQINKNDAYKIMAYKQFTSLKKNAYPVLSCSPEEAIKTAEDFLSSSNVDWDIILFDLPGTVNSKGVLSSLANMDFIFTPISADHVALASSLSFANTINNSLVKQEQFPVQGIYLFWNQVHGNEKTNLYDNYEKTIKVLKLPLLKTHIPNSVRFKKELSTDKVSVFRSTLFPVDKTALKGSNLEELITEIEELIKLGNDVE